MSEQTPVSNTCTCDCARKPSPKMFNSTAVVLAFLGGIVSVMAGWFIYMSATYGTLSCHWMPKHEMWNMAPGNHMLLDGGAGGNIIEIPTQMDPNFEQIPTDIDGWGFTN